jgi:hypothetical protein
MWPRVVKGRGHGAGARSDCFNQQWPRLIVQNMTFKDGNSTAQQTSDGFETAGFRGIFYIGEGRPVVISSTLG